MITKYSTNFILASGNKHKALEFEALFENSLQLASAPQSLDVDECGKTFTENAFLKAKAYFESSPQKIPTLADDSGLVLEAFPDLLGVQSARFAPELPNYAQKCQKILDLYQQNKDLQNPEKRKAKFVCVLCFYFSPDEVFFFEGHLEGRIAFTLKGHDGFGYDPIFIPERSENDGKTLAELADWKKKFSHRAKASQAALKFLKGP